MMKFAYINTLFNLFSRPVKIQIIKLGKYSLNDLIIQPNNLQ